MILSYNSISMCSRLPSFELFKFTLDPDVFIFYAQFHSQLYINAYVLPWKHLITHFFRNEQHVFVAMDECCLFYIVYEISITAKAISFLT